MTYCWLNPVISKTPTTSVFFIFLQLNYVKGEIPSSNLTCSELRNDFFPCSCKNKLTSFSWMNFRTRLSLFTLRYASMKSHSSLQRLQRRFSRLVDCSKWSYVWLSDRLGFKVTSKCSRCPHTIHNFLYLLEGNVFCSELDPWWLCNL